MPAGNGREKTKGRCIDVLSATKKVIAVVKAAFLCLVHSLIIAKALVSGDPKYKSCKKGRGLKQPLEGLLNATGFNLINAGGFKELEQFQNYLSDYKIVYDGLSHYRVIFSGNSLSNKKLYLLYDSNFELYNVITNIKAVMAKMYICDACSALYNAHKCDKACSWPVSFNKLSTIYYKNFKEYIDSIIWDND